MLKPILRVTESQRGWITDRTAMRKEWYGRFLSVIRKGIIL